MFWVYWACSLGLLTIVPCSIMVRRPGSRQRVYTICKTITVVSGFLLILPIIEPFIALPVFIELIENTIARQVILVLLAAFLASLITTAVGFVYQEYAREEEMKKRWKY